MSFLSILMNSHIRHLLIVLVGFPLVYTLYSLTPWTQRLFGGGESQLFIPFWSGIVALHWGCLYLVICFLKAEGKSLRNLGYSLSRKQTARLVAIYVVIAVAMLLFTEWSLQYVSLNEEKVAALPGFFPKSTGERLFFILTVFTAGFCEEIIYRGYALTQLTKAGLNRWVALLPAGLSFVFIHGVAALLSPISFASYLASALLLGGIFLLTKSLLPSIVLHLLFDLVAMMAIFQAVSPS